MTADQKFLKAAHIRPDDPVTENWMDWRDDEINGLRSQIAEYARTEWIWIDKAMQLEKVIHMWQLCAFAGWFGLFLFAMQGHW